MAVQASWSPLNRDRDGLGQDLLAQLVLSSKLKHREVLLTWSLPPAEAQQGFLEQLVLVTPPPGLKPKLPVGYTFPNTAFSYSNIWHRHSLLCPTLPGRGGKWGPSRKASQRLPPTSLCSLWLSSVWTEFSRLFTFWLWDQKWTPNNLKAASGSSVDAYCFT